MSKVYDLNSLFHHFVNKGSLETEGEFILAHQLIDENFPSAEQIQAQEAATEAQAEKTAEIIIAAIEEAVAEVEQIEETKD